MTIKAIRMPKWGLAMEEGTIIEWLKSIGDDVAEGDDLIDIETTKITNTLQATNSGRLVRILAGEDEVMPVGALIGVLVEGKASEDDIDAFIAASPVAVVEEDEGEETASLALQTVEARGKRINVGLAGSGPAIVLLHGFSGDLNNWMFTIEDLKGVARVIAPDLPGHGASEKAVGDGTLATMAGDVAAVLDDLGVADAVVAGHSLGGAIAMQLALDRPDLVSRLALVCPAGLPGGTLSDEFLSAIVTAEKARDVKKALQLLVRDPDTVSRDMVDGVVRMLRLDGAQAALGLLRERMLEGSDMAALRARLGELPETTLIASHNDAIVGAPDTAALPPGWSVHWLDEAGHLPQLEAASRVGALLRELI
ncbi:acetoin dehydrogenase dihydrolipoyllysine-residue acetyltransferase subunit [Seohaeicola zhoushanensis]|uniref:Acetoin dehydrogenase dihydrolipoyllysine-residue acetyltransferase subunit n=1 Tax=Seohaeicola zhoushanensis TaxID=1569283 RepID=A0A8J3GY33_9RHOB|nr:acetoin dehydrogenase dihydrolipoyllysine-residue acetyltransferase subunit [Seohaeicola zhoushanensis]GHF49479.1 acetoin dehydrogenase dihydrolipoyllysine-residue acetyltransferase subunit [Seohaeicola zhoushanensis]